MSLHSRAVLAAVTLLVAESAQARAQQSSPLHRGGWIVSGSGSVGRTHDDAIDEDVTHLGIDPTGLVFVSRHFAVGATLPFSYANFSNPAGHEFTYGIGPAARYFFPADSSPWLPFVSASVQPQWQKLHRTVQVIAPPPGTPSVTTLDLENRLVTVDGSLGVTRLLAQQVGLTGELYYTHTARHVDQSRGGPTGSYDAGARFGLTVFVN